MVFKSVCGCVALYMCSHVYYNYYVILCRKEFPYFEKCKSTGWKVDGVMHDCHFNSVATVLASYIANVLQGLY